MIKVLHTAYSYFLENTTEQNSTEIMRDRGTYQIEKNFKWCKILYVWHRVAYDTKIKLRNFSVKKFTVQPPTRYCNSGVGSNHMTFMYGDLP